MSQGRRKCLVKRNDFDKPTEAYFEMYGSEVFYDESNNSFPVTVAIVETIDGKVLKVNPSTIKFV
ncbi:conserved hypothetical protein [Vibrio owensii]|uniref:Uncharacterized protein n=1 Tax=Vibrio owensii TaxID=696485 RepID=A0AAU9Q6I9_9VIBR|nr:conserved hypothetical protein [Vibrio owensii]